LEPLIGAIAAGNAVVLKPSELAPATAKFLEDNIGEYMDATAVKVVQGGPAVGEQLMENRWDKVLFTGKSLTDHQHCSIIPQTSNQLIC
jgi:aldehyde dehydrogenase (NAD+)